MLETETIIEKNISNNPLISNLNVVQDAIDNNLFKDYSPNHFFAQNSNEVLTFTTNLFRRLDRLNKYFDIDDIRNIISDKLSAGKSHYNEDTFRQVYSEIEILGYFMCFFGDFSNNIKYEPKLNNKRNPEISFEYKNKIYQIEVKSPTFNYLKKITDGDIFINYRVTDNLRKEIILQARQKGIECHCPQDNKFKDYLESAQTKFSDETAQRNSNQYGILFVNWDNFVMDNTDPTFDNLDAIFFNDNCGIFTENSFIKDENGNAKTFDRVCGVIVYQRTCGDYGDNTQFIDYRLFKKYFIKNPFAKDIDSNIIQQIFLTDVKNPKNNYAPITILDF